MTEASRKLLVGLAILLALGAAIGWVYGQVDRGLLVAALLALLWQVRHLVAFDRALHTRNFDAFRYGEGLWQQIYSRFSYERERGNRYKLRQRELLKEIRKSTDAMPDGAVVLDSSNEIVICNRAAKALAGLKPKKDRGQRVDNILRHPGMSDLLAKNDAERSIDIESPVRDNSWINCRVVPYGAAQKLLLIRDVTDRIRLNRMRRDFVANASHELRSPLTVIGGYLDSFADDHTVPEELAHPIAQMRAQAKRMNNIVSELLELSRLESGGSAPVDETVDIGAVMASARKVCVAAGNAPTINLQIESNALLLGNSGEIESIVTNLLSNAVRHTPADGEVTLMWRSGPDGGELIVSDSGEGIAAEHLPRLTERFFRVDRGRARSDGGVGLGLAIVKHVLERHDAVLTVSSEPGAGSEFVCRFPARRISVTAPLPLTT
jgi:two-component system phosphate regulon sensor histidine kinase PhoR